MLIINVTERAFTDPPFLYPKCGPLSWKHLTLVGVKPKYSIWMHTAGDDYSTTCRRKRDENDNNCSIYDFEYRRKKDQQESCAHVFLIYA